MEKPLLPMLGALLVVLGGCTPGLYRQGAGHTPATPQGTDTAAGEAPPRASKQAGRPSPPLPSPSDRRVMLTLVGAVERSEALPTQPPAELWARIRSGFGLPHPAPDRVQRQRNRYRGHPGYLQRVGKRARPYLYYIVERVEARGMPTEVALLPVVESAFLPFAQSSWGAAGLWQIMASTGRDLGLTQDWWFDGRRDLPNATAAALDYLSYLHTAFDGDWLLAIAAYNAGEGTVRRAIRRNEAAGKPADFWHLPLPAETRRYVPRLLAVRDLIAAPEKHGIALEPIPNQPALDIVELDGQIELATAARLAGIEAARLALLNAGFRRWATAPDGPQRLLVPRQRAERLRRELAAMPASERLSWRRHRIRRGETLSGIAQRYGTRVDVLRRANGLAGDTIRAGKVLRVPLAASTALASSSARRRVYTVRSGDSLYRIAQRFDVSMTELRRWNDLTPGGYLQPGERLRLGAAIAGDS